MVVLKYLIIFILIFIFIYLFYFFSIVNPQIRVIKGKGKRKKKEKKLPTEVVLLSSYYGIDIERIGKIRLLRILNFVNSLMLTILVMIVLPIKESWLKMLVLCILIMPFIWVTYYFLAKYLKYLEGKSE